MTPNFSTIQALIFDLDGTLADTIGGIRDGINETMRRFGYPEKEYEDIRRAIGNGARLLVRRCMPEADAADEDKVSAVLSAYDAAYSHTYLHTRACYAGVVETVQTLGARGYLLAVLSNKQDIYTRALVEQLLPGIPFEVVMGQTDLPTKPDPAAPRLIAARLGVEPGACAMIGDSEVDMETAKQAEMLSVGCAWGYRGEVALMEAGAQAIVRTPRDLLELFHR